MSKIGLKLSLMLTVLCVVMMLTGMRFNSSIKNLSSQNFAPDTLKTINNYQVKLLKDETIHFDIQDYWQESDYVLLSSSSTYKKGENQRISSSEYNLKFNHLELIKNDHLITPEELNLYNAKSSTKDLKSLMSFSFIKCNPAKGYQTLSWWRAYVEEKASWSVWNDEDPNQYYMPKDKDGMALDYRRMDIFHNLMKNKLAREIIYESIEQNFNLISSQISTLQKRLMLIEIKSLIPFCENYLVNRKMYLKGRTSITEKPGEDYNNSSYGYKGLNEGFLFRRIEYDSVPPLELARFLREFQTIIMNSLNSSDFNSNMSCDINGGNLIINSYVNSKNILGFLIRTSKNNGSYFVPSQDIKITKLEIKGKDFWRIVYNSEKSLFITLDENLNKV